MIILRYVSEKSSKFVNLEITENNSPEVSYKIPFFEILFGIA